MILNSQKNNYERRSLYASKVLQPKVAFKGAGTVATKTDKPFTLTKALKFIDDPVKDLFFVNMTCMVSVRILIDSFRNKYAAAETAFYELFSTAVNYGLPFVAAMGVSSLISHHDKNGINFNGFVKNNTIKTLGSIYSETSKNAETKEKSLNSFISKIADDLRGPASNQLGDKQTFIDNMHKAFSQNSKEVDKGTIKYLSRAIGSYDKVKLKHGDLELCSDAKTFLNDILYLGKQFQKSHGLEVSNGVKPIDAIVKKLTTSNNIKSAIALVLVCGLGYSAQFINRWITKKRTGKDEFVGYKDFGTDDKKATADKTKATESKDSKNEKIVNSSVANSSTDKTKSTAFKGLPSLESSMKLPTRDQLAYVIYPVGILGRWASVRSKDEFREVFLKTTWAFACFLLIPNLVKNLAAKAYKNKNIFHNPKLIDDIASNPFKKIKNLNNLSIRSYNDIKVYARTFAEDAVTNNKNLNKALDGVIHNPKLKDSVKESLKTAVTDKAKIDIIKRAIKQELNKIKNVSKIASIVYSFLTLSVLINVYNQHVTNKKRAKELAEKNKKKVDSIKVQDKKTQSEISSKSILNSPQDAKKNKNKSNGAVTNEY